MAAKQPIFVSVNLDGKTHQGSLYLGKWDEVFVDLKDSIISRDDLPLITCETDGKKFFLHHCDLSFGRIYSKYIVDSFNQKTFSSFEFYLDSVTEWLESLDKSNGELFNQSVKIGGTEYNCTATLKKKKFVITVESINDQVELESIEFITAQFARLFSFLCYNKVTCCGASILNNKNKYPVYSFLFNESKYRQSCHDSLLSARLIHAENLWPIILRNYFETNTKPFDDCLNNFWGQIRFKGYWGHEFLDLFALLDRYTKIKNVGKEAKVFSAESVNSAIQRVKAFIASQEGLNDEEKHILCALPKKIKKLNEWNLGNSAKSRIHYLLSKDGFFNEDEQAIFTLIDANLKRLLDLRIKIAHGVCLDSQGGHIYNNFFRLIYQLKILVAWIIYRELGISSKIIWLGTRDSRHNDAYNAKIDTTRLSVMIGDIPVFQVPKKTFEYFSKMRIDSCFIFDPKKKCLNVDEFLSSEADKKLHECRLRTIENAVSAIVPKYKNPVYLNRILIEYDKNYKMIWGVVITNYECIPTALQETCKKWMRWLPERFTSMIQKDAQKTS